MSQDEVNEQFRAMMFANTVDEADEVVGQIVSLESKARHAMTCEEDQENASQFANAAYAVLAGVSLKLIPTVTMGIADLFNREHEAYLLALDHISDTLEHLRTYRVFLERGDTALARAELSVAEQILAQGLEGALYEKVDES